MPEIINIMAGDIARYSSPKSIPSASFTILGHEGLVTLTVKGTSIGDNYSRNAIVRVDGVQIKKWVVSNSFTYTTQLDLATGLHTLEVEISSWVGYWEISADAEYTLSESVPTLPPVITDSSPPIVIISDGGILTVFATAEDDDPSTYEISVDGVIHDSGQWVISPMKLEYNCVGLPEGTHNVLFRFDDQSGLHSSVSISAVIPSEGDGNGDGGIEDIDILPAIIVTVVGIITTAGAWFLTDGFTRIPDPSQFFSGFQLPF